MFIFFWHYLLTINEEQKLKYEIQSVLSLINKNISSSKAFSLESTNIIFFLTAIAILFQNELFRSERNKFLSVNRIYEDSFFIPLHFETNIRNMKSLINFVVGSLLLTKRKILVESQKNLKHDIFNEEN